MSLQESCQHLAEALGIEQVHHAEQGKGDS
jgi:hypothetical protein